MLRPTIRSGLAPNTSASDRSPVGLSEARLNAFHPFLRLTALLQDIPPGPSAAPDGKPIQLQVGEPRNAPPAFVPEVLAEASAGWSRYPPARGDAAYRAAAADWLTRRYELPAGFLDPERHILPLPGTREGLFFTAVALAGPGGAGLENGRRPAILMPNPAYHVYSGAAAAIGAEAIWVPATPETGFQPDYPGLEPALLERAALAYLCSPANPQGSVAGLDKLAAMIGAARRYGFAAAFDECYSEIYFGAPPPGALQAAAESGSLEGVLAFHSLSKRSSAPGLRCGFVAGEAALIDSLDQALRYGGAGVPLPVLAAGTRLWQDEDHVEANRRRYGENFAIAERILGNRFGARTPAGAFFLWLDVGDGEAAALKLWREAGIRVLPGAYMCGTKDDDSAPGKPYIRIALVDDPPMTEVALSRLVEVLQ